MIDSKAGSGKVPHLPGSFRELEDVFQSLSLSESLMPLSVAYSSRQPQAFLRRIFPEIWVQ